MGCTGDGSPSRRAKRQSDAALRSTPRSSRPSLRSLPRNIWAASLASFFTDVSSEMFVNVFPLFLANVLGVGTVLIGLIEGLARTTASLLDVLSGRLSDRLGVRKWLAVGGYAISTLAKPVFYWASSWPLAAVARWLDRVGKGVRTAPRDALVAGSIDADRRGLAFGFHRAADTGGAVLGLAIAAAVVWGLQGAAVEIRAQTFRVLVLASLLPAALGVLVLARLAHDVREPRPSSAIRDGGLRGLGRPFGVFLAIVALFELGNSADAFLILRAQERGLSLPGVLLLLLGFNLVYALVSTPAGRFSDRYGRRRLLLLGWLLYTMVYLGFAFAYRTWQIALLYLAYGGYYGLCQGNAKALVADLVPDARRAAAYGAYSALLGVLGLPASLIAGVLWQGVGAWHGFGPAAPFALGAALALVASLWLGLWRPVRR